ncbi:MAG: hypothetical protein ABSC77_14375 [Terracidiphilus sp.]|jgi:hypothetical protein
MRLASALFNVFVGRYPLLKSVGNSDILNPHGGGPRGLLGSFRCFMVSRLLQPALDPVTLIPLGMSKLFSPLS